MRKIFSVILLAVLWLPSLAQLKSPEEFLGYPLGSRFTPHHKIVAYFQYLQQQAPQKMKYMTYGETYEGRPLTVAFISSEQNIARLEEIRTVNLAMAGFGQSAAAFQNHPAIVWMSYNVHGNEASSSEASMLTAYELLSGNIPQVKEWLNKLVIAIDPCLNPDGRDRYVNWQNSVRGVKANPHVFTREHNEPWPGGRPNHYYFDLNRDWAWQSQIESQKRMELYNKWLPQIHIDFHEQGYNNPYYFAPAAEPFHEVITDWQREFQTRIGINNAKYFDKHGWLYFTRERFDLLYPSYGDTYPTYKGAIGMTYEQAGHSLAGTAVITSGGDTLTLYDRLLHHHTTGLSTIEITAENADKVKEEFRKYYNNAVQSPPGKYKSFLIKADNGDRLKRLKQLLNRNQIQWDYAASAAKLTGYRYFTGKTENVTIDKGDIVINLNQPNANLISVLFEQNTALSDSNTYDITAWALPYVFGLETYGLNTYLGTDSKNAPEEKFSTNDANAYAYAINWTGVSSAKALSELLQKGVKVRFAEEPFRIGDKDFSRGTLIITRAGNAAAGNKLFQYVQEATEIAGIEFYAISTGFVDKGYDMGSGSVRMIRAPRIGLFSGDRVSSLNMGEIWHFFDQELNYPLNIITVDQLSQNTLNQFDVLILPDGNYDYFTNKQRNELLKNWVSAGNKLIVLGRMASLMTEGDWGLKMKKEEKKDEKKDKPGYDLLKRYEDRERSSLAESNPGSIFRVELDNTHPLAFGFEDYYFTLKQNASLFEFIEGNGWNVGVLKKNSRVAGFVGSKLNDKLQDGLVFGELRKGRGSVIVFGDNPLFRSFWESGKLLFSNAVFLCGQ